MCRTLNVFHLSCKHWGRDRFLGEPCARSRLVNGVWRPCTYVELCGADNTWALCPRCVSISKASNLNYTIHTMQAALLQSVEQGPEQRIG
jgi:hypothetical protein